MSAELNARSLESSDFSKDRIELEGLESFFEDDHAELYAKGLSIKQAVFYYGDTRKSLKAKVENGLVPAIRLPESHGKKWRVFPDGVPEQLQELIPKNLRSNEKEYGKDSDSAQNDELIETEEVNEFAHANEIGLGDKRKPVESSELKVAKSAAGKAKQNTKNVIVDAVEVVHTVEASNNLDFSIPGIDCPGQLILKAAGFLVSEEAAPSLSAPDASALIHNTGESIAIGTGPICVDKKVAAEAGLTQASRAVLSNNFAYQAVIPVLWEYTHAAVVGAGLESGVAEGASGFGPALLHSRKSEEPSIFKTIEMDLLQAELLGSLPVVLLDNLEPFSNSIQTCFELPLPESSNQYKKLSDKIAEFEKQLAQLSYQNSYLETRLSGVEDQLKFFAQSNYQNRSFNKLLLVVPALALIAVMLLFQFSGQIRL